jgi:hypothetical protein
MGYRGLGAPFGVLHTYHNVIYEVHQMRHGARLLAKLGPCQAQFVQWPSTFTYARSAGIVLERCDEFRDTLGGLRNRQAIGEQIMAEPLGFFT